MISEATARAWCVTTEPIAPSELQFFGGQTGDVSRFYVDWRMAIALTRSEAGRVKQELEQKFSRRGDKFNIVWLGDVI